MGKKKDDPVDLALGSRKGYTLGRLFVTCLRAIFMMDCRYEFYYTYATVVHFGISI